MNQSHASVYSITTEASLITPTVFMCCQVPCSFAGGVVVKVDRFRPSAGGWVRLLFKNVNGAPVNKVEFSKVGALRTWYHAAGWLSSSTHLRCL